MNIMHMGHVALRVTDLDRTVTHVTQALGLHETGRTEHEVLLSANRKHHELQLIASDTAGLDHVGLEVESAAELDDVRARVEGSGATMLAADAWDEPGIGAAIRFVGPAGIVYEVYDGMQRHPLTIDEPLTSGIERFGHLTFYSNEAEAVVAFWVDVLGFRISDVAEGLTWTRCDQDHHGLAVLDFPDGTLLHHHAWAVSDWSAMGVYCDSLARHGLSLAWGPVRHGPGFNLATYLPDPDGAMIEVYTDLLQIDDERSYVPIDWSDEPRALNLWGPPPGPEVLSAGIPVLAPRGERVS
jgi:catechol 2,3-dioxygenase-like lactoylglutathione lyase family enzyme